MRKVELLAPAKNKDVAISAINCGADAIYIGAQSFGARQNAGNSISDIEEVIKYAHLYNARVYVTLNTLLRDNELNDAQSIIKSVYEAGADALIIQDFGLLECDLPPIPIHASTQMHNNSVERIKFLENIGIQRVILPREMSLEQIREVKEKTDIELESFVHGALCVSYSGQCYMSYAIGKRSANRGECAQPCRKKYTLVDDKGNVIASRKHLLSLKDFNLSNNLESLIDAGVTSFKVEGRLKDEAYVKNVVSYYRRELDKFSAKTSSGRVSLGFEPDLNKTFNRGYTKYFIEGRGKDITQFKTPKSLGEPLGNVVTVGKNSFKLATKERVNAGDGLCFFDKDGELKGTVVNGFKNGFIFVQNIKGITKGIFLYRNFNQEFTKTLKNSKVQRKISLDIKVYEKEGQIVFDAVDEDGIKSSNMLPNNFELAQNKEKALVNFEKQFSKLGEAPFELSQIQVDLSETPFIPVSQLNDIRRQLVDNLIQNRLKNYTRQEVKIQTNDNPYPEKELYYNANVLNSKAREFYNRHGAKVVEAAAESGIKMHGKVAMTTKHCLRYSFDKCLKKTKDNNKLYLIDEKNYRYELEFDCKNCEMKILY